MSALGSLAGWISPPLASAYAQGAHCACGLLNQPTGAGKDKPILSDQTLDAQKGNGPTKETQVRSCVSHRTQRSMHMAEVYVHDSCVDRLISVRTVVASGHSPNAHLRHSGETVETGICAIACVHRVHVQGLCIGGVRRGHNLARACGVGCEGLVEWAQVW